MHSCLSPCADDEMTPWNMVGMSKIKGLDVIAVTDHNACLNAEDAMAAGREYGVEVIPGMEITSREEVHILGYFYTLEDALKAGEEVYAHLPAIDNNPLLFGNQIIMRDGDTPSGTLDKLLINATDLSVDEVCELVRRHHGVPVPAHINRGSNGMIGALGLMPFLPEYPVVEVYKGVDCPAYAMKGRFLLHSSDAHHLEDIQEQVFELDTEPTAQAVLKLIEKMNQPI
ncbi:MAG: PHP domain-containing protein [bacterium]|nr:PHP domain-containing protein [bacterium]